MNRCKLWDGPKVARSEGGIHANKIPNIRPFLYERCKVLSMFKDSH